MKTTIDHLDECLAFTRDNIVTCCKELVEMRTTGIIPTGKIRELSNMLKKLESGNSIQMAIGMVEREAVELISKTNEKLS